ncbi:unnamed protein product, partial [Schistosoma curassoni]|uniref:Ovule protein n=1 Tax=Schistosoma curassoni TaxID=6186 RepID=A0A183KME8_9TREM
QINICSFFNNTTSTEFIIQANKANLLRLAIYICLDTGGNSGTKAVHIYVPKSSSFKFSRFSETLRERTSLPPSRLHSICGVGLPIAGQSIKTSSPSDAVNSKAEA